MTRCLPLALVLTLAAVAGCSTTSYCTGELPYQSAETLPPLRGAEGLEIPQSQAALRVPDGPYAGPGYAQTYVNEKGKKRVRCLDVPPALPPAPEPTPAQG